MSGGPLVEIGGITVERDVLGVIEEIQRRWPELSVQYLDPDQASGPSDPPWRIVENCKDGFQRMVFGVWQLDKRVIDRLYAADMQNPDFLKNLDAHNIAVRMEEKRRFREQLDEAKDIVEHVIKSPKGRYSIPSANGGVFLVDDTTPGKRIK